MYKFNHYEFGEKLRIFRKSNQMNQDKLAKLIGIDRTTIGKYENGERTPDIDVLINICNVLKIKILDLIEYEEDKEFNKNPFKTNILYVYYVGKSKKDLKSVYKWEIVQEENGYEVLFYIDDDTIYMKGKMKANDECAFIDFENYGDNNRQLEVTHIMVNLRYTSDGLLMGTLNGNVAGYIKATKKILVSKEKVEFTDEMLQRLFLTAEEKKGIEKYATWYADTRNTSIFGK